MAKRRQKYKRPEDEMRFRTNNFIRIPEIRLVGDNLDKISEVAGQAIEPGVYPTKKAIKWAEALDLDLVEISAKANPPVCRIIDYSKFLYDKKKKQKEIKSKAAKTVIKEIRFGPNTDEHDFKFKLRHAQKFLEDGAKVKAYVQFRGRSIVFKERGELLLLKFIQQLEEYGVAEALPKMEGRRMFLFIAPKKAKVAPKAPKKAKVAPKAKVAKPKVPTDAAKAKVETPEVVKTKVDAPKEVKAKVAKAPEAPKK